MLSPEQDISASVAFEFSPPSDVVELVVLTGDDIFLQTLREAVGSNRRLSHVPSADKVSDLLVAGQVGILVLDVSELHADAAVYISQIKRQFPDLVVVVAGSRDAETSLARLISAGTVYRFIHKPMSPGRAKLFAEAAIKKFSEGRKRAAESVPVRRALPSKRGLLLGVSLIVAALVVATVVAIRLGSSEHAVAPEAGLPKPAAIEPPLLQKARAALEANRLAEPAGDNALELFQQARAQYPESAAAGAGLLEVRERLLARAENALLEERLDEAAASIETARISGVEGGRINFLTAQLAKSREHQKSVQAMTRTRNELKPDEDRVTPLLNLAAQRTKEGRLIEPERDNARFYVGEALRLDPEGDAAKAAKTALATSLLKDIYAAIDRRDFTRAHLGLAAADGVISPANIETARKRAEEGHQQANALASNQLLNSANERLQQDRLIEPENDNAKYYLMTLRGLDPGNAGLGPALRELGGRLTVKARRALSLQQYDAAQSWLDEAAAIGFSTGESDAVRRDLESAAAQQRFLTNIVDAGALKVVRSVPPVYPPKAELKAIEGWVELDFTIAENGEVKDIALHAADPAGTFDAAAMRALSQWRFKPVLRGDKPVSQRARTRIRFVLKG